MTHRPWGIKPEWATRTIINARCENVPVKKTWRMAFNKLRCVIPASGWYEWKAGRCYEFKRTDGEPLAFAGLLLPADNGHAGVIVTRPAEGWLRDIHDRMPAVLDEVDMGRWLGVDRSSPGLLVKSMEAFDAGRIAIEPVTLGPRPQAGLFGEPSP